MTEDEVDVRFREIAEKLADDWTKVTVSDLDMINDYWERRRAERKSAERPYAIPGLDVPWWNEDGPTKVWEHEGVVCAITPTPTQPGFNGYVLLPQGHPWRQLDLQMDYTEANPDVHGGITFGPHVTGWIGFDTAHAGDNWHPAEVLKLEVPRDILAHWREHAEIIARVERRYPTREPWDRWWTVERLVAEIEQLARQVKEAMP